MLFLVPVVLAAVSAQSQIVRDGTTIVFEHATTRITVSIPLGSTPVIASSTTPSPLPVASTSTSSPPPPLTSTSSTTSTPQPAKSSKATTSTTSAPTLYQAYIGLEDDATLFSLSTSSSAVPTISSRAQNSSVTASSSAAKTSLATSSIHNSTSLAWSSHNATTHSYNATSVTPTMNYNVSFPNATSIVSSSRNTTNTRVHTNISSAVKTHYSSVVSPSLSKSVVGVEVSASPTETAGTSSSTSSSNFAPEVLMNSGALVAGIAALLL